MHTRQSRDSDAENSRCQSLLVTHIARAQDIVKLHAPQSFRSDLINIRPQFPTHFEAHFEAQSEQKQKIEQHVEYS